MSRRAPVTKKRKRQSPQDADAGRAGDAGNAGWISARASSSASAAAETCLSPGQRRVLELAVLQRKNVFFTGAAGSGKSFVLKRMMVELEREHRLYGRVYCVAPTGLSAWHLGGTTIHSFAGIRDSDATIDEMLDAVYDNHHAVHRWQHCEVLIWDEISMIHCTFLEKLDRIARTVRDREDAPFGGIQLVVCGDFFQLPPVNLSHDAGWAFESPIWKEMFDVHIMLKTSHRQDQRSEFLNLLNAIRTGERSQSAIERLIQLSRGSPDPNTTLSSGQASSTCASSYTKLFGTNREVNDENERCLELLGAKAGPRITFVADDITKFYSKVAKRLPGGNIMPDCPALQNVVLRVGAKVILLKNLDQQAGLVNGCHGVVKGFTNASSCSSKQNFPIVDFYVGKGVATMSRKQNVVTRTIRRATWESKSGSTVIASRSQIPLRLAYALTVHKCQGQTLPSARINFKSSAFTSGQAYVALSRVSKVKCLDIERLRATDVKVSHTVVQFYKSVFGTVA